MKIYEKQKKEIEKKNKCLRKKIVKKERGKKQAKKTKKNKDKTKSGTMKNEKGRRLAFVQYIVVKTTHLKFIFTFSCRFITRIVVSQTQNILVNLK